MIVQTAPGGQPGQPHAVIAQLEHTRLAGFFAEAWGNATFAALEPRDLMVYLATHHDQGWEGVDGRVGRDKASGLPWNLVTTPLPELVKSSSRGPDFNEKHHPYCGLLSSMHTYGLFNGRYGLSDKIFIQMVGPEHRPAIEDMLAREVGRQDRLKAKLAADPATASWVSDAHLFANYKLLQFFDTLALYFNCTHEAARGSSAFANVPKTVGEDVTVTVSRLEKATYRVAPYPFQTEGLEVRWAYRNATPQDESVDMPAYLAQLPIHEEVVRLVP